MTRINEFLAEGVRHHRNGALEAARDAYRRALAEQPDHADALHLCGMTCYQLGEAAEAEQLLRLAVSESPDRSDIHSNLGLVQNKLGNFDAAVESFKTALDLTPEFKDARLNLALVYQQAEQFDAAEKTLRQLVALDPDHAEGANNLAVLIGAKGQESEAEALLVAVTERSPRYLDAQTNLANLYYRTGRFEKAVEQLKAACLLAPDDAGLQQNLADSLMHAGTRTEALEVAQRGVGRHPLSPDLRVTLGTILETLDRHEEAAASYHEALAVDPGHLDALNNLGAFFMRQEDPEAALRCFDAALANETELPDTRYNRAIALQDLGGVVQAEAEFKRALELRDDFPQAYRCLTDLYRAEGRHQEARTVLATWAAAMPNDPTPGYLLSAADADAAPPRAPDNYIAAEFDRFADHFDTTLARLEYRAPELLVDLLTRTLPGRRDLTVLDAGCGTGLAAPLLREYCKSMNGIDLSPGMIKQASKRQLYDTLQVTELVACLTKEPDAFDVIFSADTLVYFGDLAPVSVAASAALRPGGCFVFSLEHQPDPGAAPYRLNASGRYCHRSDYVESCLKEAGLTVLALECASARTEHREPVPGLLVLAVKS